jgi:hypothetical protein
MLGRFVSGLSFVTGKKDRQTGLVASRLHGGHQLRPAISREIGGVHFQ